MVLQDCVTQVAKCTAEPNEKGSVWIWCSVVLVVIIVPSEAVSGYYPRYWRPVRNGAASPWAPPQPHLHLVIHRILIPFSPSYTIFSAPVFFFFGPEVKVHTQLLRRRIERALVVACTESFEVWFCYYFFLLSSPKWEIKSLNLRVFDQKTNKIPAH